jgi:hypothetical protein
MIDCCCGHVPTGELLRQQLPQGPALGWHLIAKVDEFWLLRRFDRGVQMYVIVKQYHGWPTGVIMSSLDELPTQYQWVQSISWKACLSPSPA